MKTFFCHGVCQCDKPIAERHTNRTCRADVCISCSKINRRERVRAEKRRKHEDIEERKISQRLERDAKSKSLDAVFNDATLPKKPSRTGKSDGISMIDVDRVIEDIRSKNIIDSFT